MIGSATAPVSQYTVFNSSARDDAAAESVLPYVPRIAGTWYWPTSVSTAADAA